MLGRLWSRVRPAVFWDFARGSWQYDVVVVLILAFIFLTPAAYFNDRPSEPVVHEINQPTGDSRVFWIDPGALDRMDPDGAEESLKRILAAHSGEDLRVLRTEPARDAAGNVQAYVVVTGGPQEEDNARTQESGGPPAGRD